MELFTKIVNGPTRWLFSQKNFIIDVWQNLKYTPEAQRKFQKCLTLRIYYGKLSKTNFKGSNQSVNK